MTESETFKTAFETLVGSDLDCAISWLNQNQTVAIPTETVYGLAGNGFEPDAIRRIYEAKRRPSYNPLILHTSSLARAKLFVTEIPDLAQKLADAFWPGPLTMLLPKSDLVPDAITSGLPNVAVRVPNHPVALALLERLDFPLAAPSANPFGYISPTKSKHVYDQLKGRIPYVLEGGSCEAGIESTIVGFEDGVCIVHRLGALEISEIEEVVGLVSLKNHSSEKPIGPGMLKWHYSPRTPLQLGSLRELLKDALMQNPQLKIGALVFSEKLENLSEDVQIVLSAERTLKEAGKNLYAALHALDELGFDLILAEKLPDTGLGRALNDRLERASQRPF